MKLPSLEPKTAIFGAFIGVVAMLAVAGHSDKHSTAVSIAQHPLQPACPSSRYLLGWFSTKAASVRHDYNICVPRKPGEHAPRPIHFDTPIEAAEYTQRAGFKASDIGGTREMPRVTSTHPPDARRLPSKPAPSPISCENCIAPPASLNYWRDELNGTMLLDYDASQATPQPPAVVPTSSPGVRIVRLAVGPDLESAIEALVKSNAEYASKFGYTTTDFHRGEYPGEFVSDTPTPNETSAPDPWVQPIPMIRYATESESEHIISCPSTPWAGPGCYTLQPGYGANFVPRTVIFENDTDQTGAAREEAVRLSYQAIAMHLEAIQEWQDYKAQHPHPVGHPVNVCNFACAKRRHHGAEPDTEIALPEYKSHPLRIYQKDGRKHNEHEYTWDDAYCDQRSIGPIIVNDRGQVFFRDPFWGRIQFRYC